MSEQQHSVIVGLQYGDEGKGKFSHVLAQQHDVFVRYQGGGNAGHTIYHNGIKVVTHYLPVGIVEDHIQCILGNGMVINPNDLVAEIKEVAGLIGSTPQDLAARISVSNKAHVVTENLLSLDAEREKTQNIGTTKTGIGPTYEAKYNRTGLTIGAAVQQGLYPEFNELLGGSVTNTEILVNRLDSEGLSILFEGAQGVLLDIDFGQFPFVTSSNCIPGAVRTGAGFTGTIDRVIGVFKPYVTRVGTGPFVTEMPSNTDRFIRMAAREFGATTGRNRYCAFLDLYALKYACEVAGITELAVTKVDIFNFQESSSQQLVLEEGRTPGIPAGNEFSLEDAANESVTLADGSEFHMLEKGFEFDNIPVCIGYTSSDGVDYLDTIDFPYGAEWDNVTPIYQTVKGWKSSGSAVHQLPFLDSVASFTGVPISMVSYGPGPDEFYTLNV